MEKQISKGLKIWLWFVIIMNGLSAISNVTKIGQNALGSIISIVLEAVLIYSCVLIMFQMKKFGERSSWPGCGRSGRLFRRVWPGWRRRPAIWPGTGRNGCSV